MDGPSVYNGAAHTQDPHLSASNVKNIQPNSGNLNTISRGGNRGVYRGSRGYGRTQRGSGSQYTEPRLFNPHSSPASPSPTGFSSQHNLAVQTTYLHDVVSRELQGSITPKEMKNNESFRKKLERILQDMFREWAKDNVTVNPAHVKLKCYGSMANGFAVAGSDMDLLLMFPKDEGPIGSMESDCGRMFEKRLLDEGIGARLLTKTRVPILRVCQSPGQELLEALRTYRVKSIDQDREDKIEKKMKKLGLKSNRLPEDPVPHGTDAIVELENPAEIPLPPSPIQEPASIEFDRNVGVQCDINFTNYVAMHNTALLRCYCICDDRVKQLGLVVKAWAKARKINTPYYGTLSSYGYILMVLHYLLNVADPPVIPNLQVWAKADDSWKENPKDIPLFEGFDVRFFGDEDMLQKMSARGEINTNRESLGSLLRGFFSYYANPRGFHFGQEVISIRTRGGILRKTSKGWTEAKWAGNDSHVRLRYLFCIEDPFEIEHNVARTVGHSGIVAIRDEFRRAWEIVNKIEFVQGHGWEWRKPDGSIGEDLFAQAPDRGDLLRKDMEYNREKTRAMAKAREAQAAAEKKLGDEQKSGDNTKVEVGDAGANVATENDANDGRKSSKQGNEKGSKKASETVAAAAAISITQDASSLRTASASAAGADGKSPRRLVEQLQKQTEGHQLTPECKVIQAAEGQQVPPSIESALPSTAISTPIPCMPTPPSSCLSSLPFLCDPNQLRDLQTIAEGGNGCARGPTAYDLEGIFGNAQKPHMSVHKNDEELNEIMMLGRSERKSKRERKKEKKEHLRLSGEHGRQ